MKEILKYKIGYFQKCYDDYQVCFDISDQEWTDKVKKEFNIISSPTKMIYSIVHKGKEIISLSLKELCEIKKNTGEEDFLRFYFNQERDLWEYFQDKNVINNIKDYIEEIINVLMSYSVTSLDRQELQ